MGISRRNVLAAAGAFSAGAAFGQGSAWPTRPIEIVVPATAGGPADISARLIAVMLGEKLGQTIVANNKVGAGGAIASSYVARAEKTGYVMGMITDSTVINPIVQPDSGYTIDDFQPLTPMYMGAMALAVGNDHSARNVQEFIAHAQKAGPVSLGMYGVASSPRIAAEIFLEAAQVKMTPIPYKGEMEVIRDVIAGVTPAYFGTTASLLGYHGSGKLRILAITSTERVRALPDVPTFREEGLHNVVYRWFHGLMVPAGTPAPVVNRLTKELGPIIMSDRFRAGIAQDLTPVTMPPEEFRGMVLALRAKATQIIRDRNLKA
jgi:tripartite-type tricarboxylate transporter receptor subunit TctC